MAMQAAAAHAPNYINTPDGILLALEDLYVKAYRKALQDVSKTLNKGESLVDTFLTVI